ncbi:MAG: Na+/H+-dicarboxylate symporter, partial [Granulosicoccus sp.]
MKNLALHWQIIIGLILGVIFALLSSWLGWSEFTINWIDPFGKIFINLLKLIAVPLVLFSIIKGISGLSDVSRLGRMGAKTLFMYLVTTISAVGLGLILVNVIQPGTLLDDEQRTDNRLAYEVWVESREDVELKDGKCFTCKPELAERANTARGILAAEPMDAKVAAKMKSAKSTKDAGPLQFLVDMVPSNIFNSLNNNGLMLQVIFFAIFFGLTILMIPRKVAQPMIDLVDSANEIFLKMVDIVMKAAPFFVFALLAGVISKMA